MTMTLTANICGFIFPVQHYLPPPSLLVESPFPPTVSVQFRLELPGPGAAGLLALVDRTVVSS